MKKISFICLLGLLLAINLYAEIAVDFNDISDLNTYFNNPNLEDVTNVSDMGIDNSGSVDTPYLYMGESRVVTLKTGIPMPAVNQPITVSAYFRGMSNGGWAGVGFSSASTNIASDVSSLSCQILNVPAMGMRYYSSGHSFYNNQEAPIAISYGLGNDIPLSWYKVVYTLTPRGSDTYDATLELYQTDSTGAIGAPLKSDTRTFTNTTIDDGVLYPYFVIDGHRVSYVDNFYCSLGEVVYDYPEGGAAEPIPGAIAGNTIQFTNGDANNGTGTPSVSLNPAFTPSFTQFLNLVGAGPWTFDITTTYDWVWVVGHPDAYAGPGTITITHPAAKNETIEIQGGNGGTPPFL